MKRTATLLAALAVAFAGAAATVRTATETFVTNKIAAAVAAIPSPDFTTNNAALVETIEAKAPAPGNYATVSNRAMTAMQSHQSLQPSTNYTDAALGAFAATGSVARAAAYGTPTRWTDANGCVWSVVGVGTGVWTFYSDGTHEWNEAQYYEDGVWIANCDGYNAYADGGEDATSLDFLCYDNGARASATQTVEYVNNLVGRVALTNDIPDVSGYATPADVTAAIREQSLGGIYDSELGVWWTPHMANGAYYWTATTNVNLNAEGN